VAERRGPDLYLVDFDGTFAAADVGNRFFRRFASDHDEWDRLIRAWKAEQMSAREILARECDLARVTHEQALAFVDDFKLAPDAAALVESVRAAGHEIAIASDGLALYIERLLARAELDVPFSANGAVFDGDRVHPLFGSEGPTFTLSDGAIAGAAPDATPGCGRCGNCKGERVSRARARGIERVILVGDGFSDRCAAERADLVYAKDDLLLWCRRRGIAAVPFETLHDVARAEALPAT
jgi:2-hydroxy-3-keto-5-methylthiopentenyl-1-phosphate phosphatase